MSEAPQQHDNLLPTPGRAEFLFLALAGIFLGALVMTNAVAGKFFVLFDQQLSCGIIAYPVTFLATDLISELYGRKRANQVVAVGFLVSVFVTLIAFIAVRVPIFDQSPVTQESIHNVFGLMPGIVLGSMSAYLVAQFVDVQVFEWWKRLTKGKHLWLRNNGSTVLSQLVDTVTVVTVALVIWPDVDDNPDTNPIAWDLWRDIVIWQYVFKAGVALLDTPFFYLGTWGLRRWVQNDPRSRTS